MLLWLVLGAIVFTIYFRFVNLRCFRLAIDVVRGKYSKSTEKGEVSHFQALTAALSGTVGLGNIAGVAVAISLGGPGATFWMIVAGFLGMSSKFVECTLGVKYRHFGRDGRTYGGPMFYLQDGLAQKGWAISIIEKSSKIKGIGAGIQVSPNGLKVLDGLGVTKHIENALFEPDNLELRLGDSGKKIFSIPFFPITVGTPMKKPLIPYSPLR